MFHGGAFSGADDNTPKRGGEGSNMKKSKRIGRTDAL